MLIEKIKSLQNEKEEMNARREDSESSSEKFGVLMNEISNLKEVCDKKDSFVSDLQQQISKLK